MVPAAVHCTRLPRFKDTCMLFSRPIRLTRLLGFDIMIDASWLLVAALILWSLSSGLFPALIPGETRTVYWTMAALGLVGFACSILLHELAHAVVARRLDMPVRRIVLFVFGGVAEMEDEPVSAWGELFMAAAGPAMSFFLAGSFAVLAETAVTMELDRPYAALLEYLGHINLAIALFNLTPAYPLDGGRILRAILWERGGDMLRATRITTVLGAGFSVLLMIGGIVALILSVPAAGVWFLSLGIFIRAASDSALQRILSRSALAGRIVAQFMSFKPIRVSPDMKVDSFVQDFILRHYFKGYPVVENDRLLGEVTLAAVQKLDRSTWATTSLRDVMVALHNDDIVSSQMPASSALARMKATTRQRLYVQDNGHLVGVITYRDLWNVLTVTLNLGEDGREQKLGSVPLDAYALPPGHDDRGNAPANKAPAAEPAVTTTV